MYYETIGGGQGACPDADGPSAVHVAMSNTLNTPVEALELEFPLRMVEYSLRRGSGGDGRFRGGDGVVRELEALAPLSYSLITERRRHPPPGADGGGDGATGRNLLDGEELPAKAIGKLQTGQRLRIETPGGGGLWKPRFREKPVILQQHLRISKSSRTIDFPVAAIPLRCARAGFLIAP